VAPEHGGGVLIHERKSHLPWKLVQSPSPPTHLDTIGCRVGRMGIEIHRACCLREWGTLSPCSTTWWEWRALFPEGKGFVPSGSLLDQAHLLPSLDRGLLPSQGGPRNNGEVHVDKPAPKLLPTSSSN
jgi:hypothetical protein